MKINLQLKSGNWGNKIKQDKFKTNSKNITDYETHKLIIKSLEDDKAIDIISIDVKNKSSIVDTMIIVSGNNKRHITAMADHIKENLKKYGRKINTEGLNKSDWVLLDCNNLIVHIFLPETRSFYNLEKMWSIDIE